MRCMNSRIEPAGVDPSPITADRAVRELYRAAPHQTSAIELELLKHVARNIAPLVAFLTWSPPMLYCPNPNCLTIVNTEKLPDGRICSIPRALKAAPVAVASITSQPF